MYVLTDSRRKMALPKCLMEAKSIIVPFQRYETFSMFITKLYAAHRIDIAVHTGLFGQ